MIHAPLHIGRISVSVRSVKTPHEHFGLDDIDECFWILFEDAFGNDLRFRAGNDAVQHCAVLMRIHSGCGNLGHTVMCGVEYSLIQLFRKIRDDEKRHLVVCLIKQSYRFSRGELEDDRVKRFVPAEKQTGNDEHCSIPHQYVIPDIFVSFFKKIYGDEIRASGRSASDQTETDSSSVDQSAEYADQQDILSDRYRRNDIGEYTRCNDYERGVYREPLADEFKTERRRDGIEDQTDRRERQRYPEESLTYSLYQERHSVESAGIEAAGVYEALDVDRHDERSHKPEGQYFQFTFKAESRKRRVAGFTDIL